MTPLAPGADALAHLFRYFADHECRDDPLYARVSDDALAGGTQWWLTAPAAGTPMPSLVARSHPHGRWLQWL